MILPILLFFTFSAIVILISIRYAGTVKEEESYISSEKEYDDYYAYLRNGGDKPIKKKKKDELDK